MGTRLEPANRRRALTLIEILIAVAVLAVVVALAVPASTSSDARLRFSAAAWLIASDIEFAQVLAVADPKNPIVVRFDPANDRYWVAYAATPATPLTRQDTGEPYLVQFGAGRGESASGVDLEVQNMASNQVRFESHGGLADFTTSPRIILRMKGKNRPRLVLDISPTTGTLLETYEK